MSKHSSPDQTGRVRDSYSVYSISETQIARGLEIARERGLSAEPSGVAGLGFLDAIESLVPGNDCEKDCVLVVNTENCIDRLDEMREGSP